MQKKLIMLPGPTNVPDRVMKAMERPIINHRGEEFRKLFKEILGKSKLLFQTDQEIAVLSSSGTGGVEASVLNVIRPGDKAIVPVFGEFSSRLAEMIELAGGRAVRISREYGSTPSLEALREAMEREKGIRALYIVHNETSTGATIRFIEQASALARNYGLFVVVDAISSLGGYSIPVDKWGIDICITGSQKCLAAPPGVAILSVSRRLLDSLRTVSRRTSYFDLLRVCEYATRGETPFTPALPLFYALNEALSMLIEEGLEKRVERHERLSEILYGRIAEMGLELFVKKGVRSRTVVAVLYPESIEDQPFRRIMSSDHNVVVAGGFGPLRGKIFRIGCMGEISPSYVDITVSAISKTLTSLGLKMQLRELM